MPKRTAAAARFTDQIKARRGRRLQAARTVSLEPSSKPFAYLFRVDRQFWEQFQQSVAADGRAIPTVLLKVLQRYLADQAFRRSLWDQAAGPIR